VGGTAAGHLGNALSTLVQARGFMWFGAAQNAAWSVAMLALSGWGVSRWGAPAVAAGVAAGYLLLLWMNCWFAVDRCGLPSGTAWRIAASGALLVTLAAGAGWLWSPATAGGGLR